MQKIRCRLTVFFENPFWVGVYERVTGGQLEVCKITFGAEPKDYEVYDLLLRHWGRLRFSPPVKADRQQDRPVNPKRMQREIKRQLSASGVGTKAQQAIILQQGEGKQARKKKSRQEREREQKRQFALRQQKKKQKHRGR